MKNKKRRGFFIFVNLKKKLILRFLFNATIHETYKKNLELRTFLKHFIQLRSWRDETFRALIKWEPTKMMDIDYIYNTSVFTCAMAWNLGKTRAQWPANSIFFKVRISKWPRRHRNMCSAHLLASFKNESQTNTAFRRTRSHLLSGSDPPTITFPNEILFVILICYFISIFFSL